jgi:hypothetical protein
LHKIYKTCDWAAESFYLGGYDSDDDRDEVDAMNEEGRKAMEHYRSICLAWDDGFSPANRNIKDAETLEYQRILHQCHGEYRQKHEEQLQLVTDESFVKTIA